MKRGEFFQKNVSRPSNPPDELAPNVSKKNPRRTNYSSIFSAKVQNLAVFFIYLHDSNSIFRAGEINSEWVSGCTVMERNRKKRRRTRIARYRESLRYGDQRCALSRQAVLVVGLPTSVVLLVAFCRRSQHVA